MGKEEEMQLEWCSVKFWEVAYGFLYFSTSTCRIQMSSLDKYLAVAFASFDLTPNCYPYNGLAAVK